MHQRHSNHIYVYAPKTQQCMNAFSICGTNRATTWKVVSNFRKGRTLNSILRTTLTFLCSVLQLRNYISFYVQNSWLPETRSLLSKLWKDIKGEMGLKGKVHFHCCLQDISRICLLGKSNHHSICPLFTASYCINFISPSFFFFAFAS